MLITLGIIQSNNSGITICFAFTHIIWISLKVCAMFDYMNIISNNTCSILDFLHHLSTTESCKESAP